MSSKSGVVEPGGSPTGRRRWPLGDALQGGRCVDKLRQLWYKKLKLSKRRRWRRVGAGYRSRESGRGGSRAREPSRKSLRSRRPNDAIQAEACGRPVDSAGVVLRYRDAAIAGRRQRGPSVGVGQEGWYRGKKDSRPFGGGSLCFRPPLRPSPRDRVVPGVESHPAPDAASSPEGRVGHRRWDSLFPGSG